MWPGGRIAWRREELPSRRRWTDCCLAIHAIPMRVKRAFRHKQHTPRFRAPSFRPDLWDISAATTSSSEGSATQRRLVSRQARFRGGCKLYTGSEHPSVLGTFECRRLWLAHAFGLSFLHGLLLPLFFFFLGGGAQAGGNTSELLPSFFRGWGGEAWRSPMFRPATCKHKVYRAATLLHQAGRLELMGRTVSSLVIGECGYCGWTKSCINVNANEQ